MRIGDEFEDTSHRRYRVTSELGSGGQGTAYRLSVLGTKQSAVLKRFDPAVLRAHPDTRDRMGMLARLRLPMRSATLGGAPFSLTRKAHGTGYVACLADGEPILDYLARCPGDLLRTVPLAAALAKALAVAESEGVAHGDISSANVLVAESVSGLPVPTLIDFDAAHIKGASPPPRIGTPLYRAPEIIDGSARPSAKSDRFALGVLIHELLLARHPWGDEEVDVADDRGQLELIRRQGFVQEDDHERAGGVPSSVLGKVVRRMLRRSMSMNASDRPSARQWSTALRAMLEELWECAACQFISRDEPTRQNRCPVCDTERSSFLISSNNVHIQLRPPIVLVGRATVSGDRSVSHRHAVFECVGFRWLVRDVSRRGTSLRTGSRWVKLPCGEPIELRTGDELRLGDALTLRCG